MTSRSPRSSPRLLGESRGADRRGHRLHAGGARPDLPVGPRGSPLRLAGHRRLRPQRHPRGAPPLLRDRRRARRRRRALRPRRRGSASRTRRSSRPSTTSASTPPSRRRGRGSRRGKGTFPLRGLPHRRPFGPACRVAASPLGDTGAAPHRRRCGRPRFARRPVRTWQSQIRSGSAADTPTAIAPPPAAARLLLAPTLKPPSLLDSCWRRTSTPLLSCTAWLLRWCFRSRGTMMPIGCSRTIRWRS